MTHVLYVIDAERREVIDRHYGTHRELDHVQVQIENTRGVLQDLEFITFQRDLDPELELGEVIE